MGYSLDQWALRGVSQVWLRDELVHLAPGPIGIGKMPAIFPAKSGRDGARFAGGLGYRGLVSTY